MRLQQSDSQGIPACWASIDAVSSLEGVLASACTWNWTGRKMLVIQNRLVPLLGCLCELSSSLLLSFGAVWEPDAGSGPEEPVEVATARRVFLGFRGVVIVDDRSVQLVG